MEYKNKEEYKISNVVIDKIYKSDKNQQGEPYESSKGNPFVKVDIYIDPRAVEDPAFEGKMTYFDYFGNSDNWDIGFPLSGTVSKNVVRDRTYFNYNPPTTGKKAIALDIKELSNRVEQLERQMVQLIKVKGLTKEVDDALDFSKEVVKEDEITASDLPF